MLSARERALAREKLLYEGSCWTCSTQCWNRCSRCARRCRELDVLAGFAERAQALDWSRPTLRDAPGIRIERGRHPVVEARARRAVRAERPGAR